MISYTRDSNFDCGRKMLILIWSAVCYGYCSCYEK